MSIMAMIKWDIFSFNLKYIILLPYSGYVLQQPCKLSFLDDFILLKCSLSESEPDKGIIITTCFCIVRGNNDKCMMYTSSWHELTVTKAHLQTELIKEHGSCVQAHIGNGRCLRK